MDSLLKLAQSPKTIITSEYKPRKRAEIDEALKTLQFISAQCTLQRDQALLVKDYQLAWFMESERVNTEVAIKSIKWALDLTQEHLFAIPSVAQFVQSNT